MTTPLMLAVTAGSQSPDTTRTLRAARCGTRRGVMAGYTALVAAAALAAQPALAAPAAAAAGTAESDIGLAEITVTAEKYKSTIQETPISLSAMSGDQLTDAGITSIETLAHDVPGLSMRSAGPGLTEYEARGLASNGGAAPTVGFYLDEIPLSPPALSQSGKVVMDPNLYDVERVEVLRGPQGTLYGSGSMGGTVKVITNKPKLDTFEGSVQGTLSDTQGGGGNYSGNLMLNLPIGKTLALRVVAGDTYRSGWIDLVTLNPFPVSLATSSFGSLTGAPVQSVIRNANDERLTSARGELLFQPIDDLSVLFTAVTQHMALGGYDLLDSTPTSAFPGPVYDAHYQAFPLREGIHDDVHIYGLDINANLDFADLTSATSYFDRLGWQTQDSSVSLYWSNHGSTPLVSVPYSEVDPSRQFTQEIRLTSHDTGPLHWVAGAFYSSLHSVWQEESSNLAVASAATPDGSYFTSYNPYKVTQTALFADGSYKFDNHWKLAAGVRWYTYKSQQDEFSWGVDAPYASPAVAPTLITKASNQGYNPRVNLSYEPNKDLNLYATVSKGFRPGGANQILDTAPPVNCQAGSLTFGPDSAWNYEIGEKAKAFDNWLTVNGDFYYIKWLGVQQVLTLPCGYQYYNNAGDGRAFGPEFEINAKLSEYWTVSFNGAYTDSKLTSPNASYTSFLTSVAVQPNGKSPACGSASSCEAPIMNVVKDTASLTLTYSTAVMGDYQLTASASDSFTGTSHDVAYYFDYQLPSYSIANARLTLAHSNWSANLFVDNLTNKVALMTANNTSFQFNIPQVVRYSTNQPRTFGTQLNYKF
ncbi:MAG: TonB-dependent receptor [Steroidobacterales bacterium]